MTHDVFISYSSKDAPVANAICHFLEVRGIRVWIAPRDISYAPSLSRSLCIAGLGTAGNRKDANRK